MKWIVEEEAELLEFLLDKSPKGRNATKAFLKRKQVYVDQDCITKHNYPLKKGQVIEIKTESGKPSPLQGLEVIHEDDHILVVNKEAGLLTMSTNKMADEKTAYRMLNAYVKAKHPKNRIYIVHRLDRDTSGLLVFAKSAKAKNILQSEWKERVKKRVYLARVEGHVEKDEGTIRSWLKESKTHQVYVSHSPKGAKEAILHFKVLERAHKQSLLEVQLETGRKNQIRVQLASIGHPIVGDKKYGAKTNPIKRLGLHAYSLAFDHPITNEYVSYTSDEPSSFKLS
ncbi:23S rRNA pseudouridine1911/1915/1917 synthase [Pelagirhabdus alkalitolerans]|uniref:Pseudouridine synthase n=1 Tax=Pelagirhabdus alkalitolerans TaxID=1612202 RepID=A0A1G6KHY5_9BACI|nr:RluA family pseudouridine synthase [Pelagirhabdus alkalitolerans]SDC30689.1 23S rRNA pseudouridine1911/1915/1917 synthase [Pelagirhabdus alkalitolerans]